MVEDLALFPKVKGLSYAAAGSRENGGKGIDNNSWCDWGVRKRTGDGLKVIWAEFSTISWVVFVTSGFA